MSIAFRLWQAIPGQEIRLAETTEALAMVYRTLGDYPAAEQALREAMKTPPAEPNSRALMLNELGDDTGQLPVLPHSAKCSTAPSLLSHPNRCAGVVHPAP